MKWIHAILLFRVSLSLKAQEVFFLLARKTRDLFQMLPKGGMDYLSLLPNMIYSCNRFSPVYIFIRTFDIPGFIVLQNLWLVGCLLQACNSEDISSLLGTFYRQYWSVPEVSPLLQCSLQFIKVQQMFWKSWDQVLQGSRFQFDRTCYSKGN